MRGNRALQVAERIIELDSNWFSSERDVTRTKGLHLSHVIDYIEFLQEKRETFGGTFSSNGHAYATEGFLWERVLERLIEESPTDLWEWLFGRVLSEPDNPKIIRPGEVRMDAGICPKCTGLGYRPGPGEPCSHLNECRICKGTGRVYVYMTPDGIHLDDVMLEEWKWTTKSAKWPITDRRFSRWINYQIPCYLKALGLQICRLRVNYSRGDYTSGVPIWKEFILTYTQSEIDDTWDCIANHAVLMYQNGIIR